MISFISDKKGFTLMEVIVVAAVFILVLTTIFSIHVFSQKAYVGGENKAEIMQNGRVILERLSREIRQAKQIVTDLPTDRTNPPSEIKFQDGHLVVVSEINTAQGGSINSITLSSSSSAQNDYYKDMFVKIVQGQGVGQIKKIISYNGANQVATIEGDWQTAPNSASSYKIDTSFYYIHYWRDNSNILREISTYCFSQDALNCVQPEDYVAWNATPPPNQSLLPVVLEQPRIVGEYVTDLEFWGDRLINIFLTLAKGGKQTSLETKIFGRNL